MGSALLMIGALYIRSHERNAQIAALYDEVANATYGLDSAAEALVKLTMYEGLEIDERLLSVALGQTPFVSVPLQDKAIELLEQRGSHEAGSQLAVLIAPHRSLVIRKAVASALQNLDCNESCVHLILHYLERINDGERNAEDVALNFIRQTEQLSDMADTIGASNLESQQHVVDALYDVLRSNSVTTTQVLINTYSIDSSVPSIFALNMIARLRLSEACIALSNTKKYFDLAAQHTEPPELGMAMRAANCELR